MKGMVILRPSHFFIPFSLSLPSLLHYSISLSLFGSVSVVWFKTQILVRTQTKWNVSQRNSRTNVLFCLCLGGRTWWVSHSKKRKDFLQKTSNHTALEGNEQHQHYKEVIRWWNVLVKAMCFKKREIRSGFLRGFISPPHQYVYVFLFTHKQRLSNIILSLHPLLASSVGCCGWLIILLLFQVLLGWNKEKSKICTRAKQRKSSRTVQFAK